MVLAWREHGEVGVDVEQVRPGLADEVADQVFALGEERTDLFGTWARKEAPVTVLRRDVSP